MKNRTLAFLTLATLLIFSSNVLSQLVVSVVNNTVCDMDVTVLSFEEGADCAQQTGQGYKVISGNSSDNISVSGSATTDVIKAAFAELTATGCTSGSVPAIEYSNVDCGSNQSGSCSAGGACISNYSISFVGNTISIDP